VKLESLSSLRARSLGAGHRTQIRDQRSENVEQAVVVF